MYPFLTHAGLALATLLPAAIPCPAPGAADDDPDLGGQLSVGGVEIPEAAIKRFLIYGVGRPSLEWRRINALIDYEISLRQAEGQDTSRFQINEEAFQKHYDKKISEFVQRFPMLDVETEIRRAYRDLEWYKRELRQEMGFDQVFVPDDPDLWPELTYEALRQEANEILIKDFRDSYDRRKTFYEEQVAEWERKKEAGEEVEARPEMPPEDSMYRSILRQIVRDTYYQIVDTKTAKDGLPPELVCTMDMDFDGENELEVTTEELWNDIKRIIGPKDISDARLHLALVEAARQRLEAEGNLMSDEEAAMALEEIASSFVSGIFDLGQIAVGGHQFPSVESYADYFPLIESYKRVVEPALVNEDGTLSPELREHLNIANQVMGLGKLDAEVLLVAAFDFGNYDWKENGWDWAEEQANFLSSEYKSNLADWEKLREKQLKSQDEAPADQAADPAQEQEPESDALEPSVYWSLLLDDYCEFWDPPQPVVGRPGSSVGYKQKGRFGERTRNDLRSLMSESPYTHFLYGEMLTDYIFFQQPIGTVEGPFVGPWGYYLVKVLRRTPPTRPLNVRNEKHVQLLKDDYLRVSFIWYAHEALDAAEVVGLPE